ncbi:hypothetical protein KFL_001400240 [Klebsormidium nitens]|uniref:Uncharacterized protein n=1 Tax=Klebsormidium nitens TaxID=105231 RepID=A0A1Y1I239_KLENI|nr:hypothetical protein KFL_001400240 [Klebsormidium nitens]|eukprot:GAQ83241.1 hypothetical protein KFL_001400240 [Klebsormidium nitens]
MERELETLIAIKGLPWLVGKDFQVIYEGRPVQTILSEIHPDGTFSGVDEHGNRYPGTIAPADVRIGRGTRLNNDPVIETLKEYKLEWEQYTVAIPGFGAFPAPPREQPQQGVRPEGQAARFGVPPYAPGFHQAGQGQAEVRPPHVQIPQQNYAFGMNPEQTPAALAAQTPAMRILQGGLNNPFHPASTARLEKTIRQLVSKGTLESHLTSVLREINPKLPAWSTKAAYLFDIYQESDSQVAHLLSAVYLYATRLNYVSPDLEWLANAFVAERKMKIEQAGDSTTWSAETRATLEAEIRHAFFESKAKADTLLGKGVVRPLFDPDKPPRFQSPVGAAEKVVDTATRTARRAEGRTSEADKAAAALGLAAASKEIGTIKESRE